MTADRDSSAASVREHAVVRAGDTHWVWFCQVCGNCEGSLPQARCCAACGKSADAIRALVRVEVVAHAR